MFLWHRVSGGRSRLPFERRASNRLLWALRMADAALAKHFFTDEELARHDGSNATLPLLFSVQGIVFDVSSARQFYGPGAL